MADEQIVILDADTSVVTVTIPGDPPVVREEVVTALELQTPGTPIMVEVITAGPQGEAGPMGDGANGLPTGGNPGNVLLKSSYGNYDAVWSPVVDGGTFN